MKNKKDSIYLITTVECKDTTNFTDLNTRCLGYFKDLDTVRKHILFNSYDLHEVNNNYVVVERVTEGLYPSVFEEFWFEWLEQFGGYVELKKKPIEFETICNWGIG